jgi:hypothetical protein
MRAETTTGFGALETPVMASRQTWWRRRLACATVVCLLFLAGCGSGDDNSPSMGAVPPKPDPNMNAKLPAEIRRQLSQAKPGEDAQKMEKTKPHASKP